MATTTPPVIAQAFETVAASASPQYAKLLHGLWLSAFSLRELLGMTWDNAQPQTPPPSVLVAWADPTKEPIRVSVSAKFWQLITAPPRFRAGSIFPIAARQPSEESARSEIAKLCAATGTLTCEQISNGAARIGRQPAVSLWRKFAREYKAKAFAAASPLDRKTWDIVSADLERLCGPQSPAAVTPDVLDCFARLLASEGVDAESRAICVASIVNALAWATMRKRAPTFIEDARALAKREGITVGEARDRLLTAYESRHVGYSYSGVGNEVKHAKRKPK
jgi:hypothetical protein